MTNLNNPANITEMANEIKKVIDAYRARKINFDELKSIILKWEKDYPQYLFEADSLKKTIILKIGNYRLSILKNILNIL